MSRSGLQAIGQDLEQFIAAITGEGKQHYQFLLYGMRARHVPPFASPDLSAWPQGTNVTPFALADDPWSVVVELFEISSPVFPDDHERVLFSTMLDLAAQGPTLAWYMFDGAFGGVTPLFTPWHRQQTYGLCIPWRAAGLTLDGGQRKSRLWAHLLAEATAHVDRLHPPLRQLARYYADEVAPTLAED